MAKLLETLNYLFDREGFAPCFRAVKPQSRLQSVIDEGSERVRRQDKLRADLRAGFTATQRQQVSVSGRLLFPEGENAKLPDGAEVDVEVKF